MGMKAPQKSALYRAKLAVLTQFSCLRRRRFCCSAQKNIDGHASVLDARLSETIIERLTRQSKIMERQNALTEQLTASVAALRGELFASTDVV